MTYIDSSNHVWIISLQVFEKRVDLLLKLKQEFIQLRNNAYLKLFFLNCEHLNTYFIRYLDEISNCLNGRSHLHLTCPSYSKISDLSITYGTLLSNSIRAMTFGSEVNRSILNFHELPINTDCYCLFDICRSFPMFGFTCNRPWYQCNAQASHRAGHNIPKLCGT